MAVIQVEERDSGQGDSRKERRQEAAGKETGCQAYQLCKKFIQITISYLVQVTVGIATVIGGMDFYDFVYPDKVPIVNSLGVNSREALMARFNTTKFLYNDFDEKLCWDAIQPSLKILDQVCPEVSRWVIDCHKLNRIIWEKNDTGTYARYDCVRKLLIFNRRSFLENDGTKAQILAHEFRHSRQSVFKFQKQTMAKVFLRNNPTYLLEPDACSFEFEIHNAIFGCN